MNKISGLGAATFFAIVLSLPFWDHPATESWVNSNVAHAEEKLANSLLPQEVKGGTVDKKPLLVACYYVWYETGDHPRWPWSLWTQDETAANVRAQAVQRPGEPPLSSAAHPLIGLYDSDDPIVAEWHVKLAQAAGFDAFLVSWWGAHMDRDKAWEQGILRASEKHGFKVALLDELAQFHEDFAWYKDALTGALGRFKDSPAYFQIDGKPVVYLYQVASNPTLTPAKFSELKMHVESVHGPVYWIVDKIAHDHEAAAAGRQDETKRIPTGWLQTLGIDCFGFYSTFSHFRAHRYADSKSKCNSGSSCCSHGRLLKEGIAEFFR